MARKNEIAELDKLKSLLQSFEQIPAIRWVPTGIHAIDLAIGGGIPQGRIIEIFGNESAGKSLLGWIIIRAFQKIGGVALVKDVEATAPLKFMSDLGVDLSSIAYSKPKTVEELSAGMVQRVDAIRKISQVPIVILWDSVAATSCAGEWEKGKDGALQPKEVTMAARARAMSDFFKHYTIWLAEKDVTLVCINQLRDKIGVMFGRKTDSPGGHALRHHASLRIELARGKKIEMGGHIVGADCYLTVQKNKCAPPLRKAQLRINWDGGFDQYQGLADVLIESGRIQAKKAGSFVYQEKEYQAKDLVEVVTANPQLVEPWL